jgi:Cellulase (glycosyl hydrolase family 5)
MTVRIRRALHRISTRLAVLATLLVSLACGCGALFAAAPASAAEAGVNLNGLSPVNVAEASALGAKWVRVFVTWPDLEPAPGVHSPFWLAQYDRLLGSLPKGTHAILDFVDTPSWESGSAAPNAPPANPADYAAILHFIAARWAGKVAAYEIWNEEDTPLWWAGGPDPAAYTRLLQAAYPAVKSADPAAEVVLGGLTGNDYNFLQGVYQAGGKGYFDAVGVHTDTACDVNSPFVFLRDADGQLDQDSFIGYREVHATELANGDDKPIWMTEMSWRTTSAVCDEGAFAGQKPEGVSDAQQATYLAQAYHCLATAPYVQLGLWYPIDDEGAVVSGLQRANHSHKPSYAALRSFIRRGDRIKGGCGDFAGPKITVETPSRGDRYTGHLWIRVRASDSEGIESIRLLYDGGHSIRNFDPFVEKRGYPHTLFAEIHWSGARHISFGRHTLTILAYDKLKNVSRTNVTIVHLPEGSSRHHRG